MFCPLRTSGFIVFFIGQQYVLFFKIVVKANLLKEFFLIVYFRIWS
jgi:hypothetical protein